MEFFTPLTSSWAPRRLRYWIFFKPTLGQRSFLNLTSSPSLVDNSIHISSKRRDILIRANHVMPSFPALRGTHSSICPPLPKDSRLISAPPNSASLMNFFSYAVNCRQVGAPLKRDSLSASKLFPSQLTNSGKGNRNRTKLPHDAGALRPELLEIFRGWVQALSSDRALWLRGAEEPCRFKRSSA